MGNKIAITGANGFIGAALVRAFHLRGYEVLALVHHQPLETIEGIIYHTYNLEDEIEASLFEGVDILIHGAFQMNPATVDGQDINIRAAKLLRSLNVPAYVFLSSLSAASPVIPSYYAKTKREIESIFETELIVRPGLVLGSGGLFGRMVNHLKKTSWVPLIDGGQQPIQTIYIDDLVTSLISLIENRQRGVYDLAYPVPITYRDLVKQIAVHSGTKVRFLNTPYFLLKGIVAIRNWVSRTAISNDNLLGLYHSRTIDTNSLFHEMGAKWLETGEAIRDVILPPR